MRRTPSLLGLFTLLVGLVRAQPTWRALVRLGREAFSGGNDGDRVAGLDGDEFRPTPSQRTSAAHSGSY